MTTTRPATTPARDARTDAEQRLDGWHLWQPFTQMQTFVGGRPFVVEKGDGPYLIDTDGKPYLNMISSLWNAPLGQGREEIIDAIADQLRTLGYSPIFRACHTKALELAGLVASISPGATNRVFLTSNGSESIESGIKMVRQYHAMRGSRKHKIISLRLGYHGVSYGALSASGLQADKHFFEPVPGGFRQIAPPYCYRCELGLTYPDCELACARSLETAILEENPDEVAMFLLEPVMGVAGCVVPPAGYFDVVGEICEKYGVFLMLDEISTGFGRTGTMFAAQHWDVKPDIVAMGKAISGGYFPLGATVATDEIWRAFLGDDDSTRFNHGSTYSGHPGACAAGIKAIDIILRENLVDQARLRGAYFFERLRELMAFDVVGDVRGLGMMFGIEFVKDKATRTPLDAATMAKVNEACFANGLFVHKTGNTILMLPPFIMDEELLDDAFARFRKVVERVGRWI